MKQNIERPAGHSSNTLVSRSQFKPMLFSTLMVQAVLEGRKTKTRRLKGLQNIDVKATEIIANNGWPKQGNFTARFQFKNIETDGVEAWEVTNVLKSPCKVGDIIWVRETWRPIEQDFGNPRYEYKATEKINITDKWKPSLFMPKEACRLFLEVTDIRVERLNDISQEDAKAEGVYPAPHRCPGWVNELKSFTDCYKCSFKLLWNSINGKSGHQWDKNEWVWVITFKPVECPQGFC